MTAIIQYQCEDCGALFDQPDFKRWLETHDSEGAPERWAIEVCPCCGSEAFEEIDADGDDEDSL